MAGHPIDSLFVEIGLDASKFDQQQREALSRFKQTQDAARKGARDVEDSGRSVVETLEGIKTQALEMFAVISGGKSLVAFSTNLTHADAAVGRLSRSTNASVDTISKWQAAARIFGGTAEGMANTFTTISDTVAGFKMGAVSPLLEQFRLLSAAGGTFVDVSKNADEILLAISANMAKISKQDPARAGFLGRSMNFDPASIDMLIRGPASLQKVIDYVHGIGVATKEDTDAFGELEKRMSQMGIKAESMGRKVLGGDHGGAARIIALADELGKDFSWANLNDTGIWEALTQSGRYGKKGYGDLVPSVTPPAAHPKGAFGSQAEKEEFIRAEAVKRGIDPDVAMRVARAEGFNNPIGDNGTSFGAFQLHVTPGGSGRAVGDRFRAQTGLDPSDLANERAGIAFALDDIRRSGWGAYHGAARSGIGTWAGIAAAGGSGSSATHDDHSIHVDSVTINAGAGADGAKIARDFRSELLRRQGEAFMANSGQQ